MITTHRCITAFYYCGCPIWNTVQKGQKIKRNITLSNFTHFDVVVAEVNNVYRVLSKLAVKPRSRSLTILATSYSPASIGGPEKNPVQLPLHKTSTRTLITRQPLPLSPSNSPAVSTVLQLPCEVRSSSLPVCLTEESTTAVHHSLLSTYQNKIK